MTLIYKRAETAHNTSRRLQINLNLCVCKSNVNFLPTAQLASTSTWEADTHEECYDIPKRTVVTAVLYVTI